MASRAILFPPNHQYEVVRYTGVGEENISDTTSRIYLGLEALEAGRPTAPRGYVLQSVGGIL